MSAPMNNTDGGTPGMSQGNSGGNNNHTTNSDDESAAAITGGRGFGNTNGSTPVGAPQSTHQGLALALEKMVMAAGSMAIVQSCNGNRNSIFF